MINPKTLTILRKLVKNNNKAWFAGHKEEYMQHKKDFAAVIDDLSFAVAQFDEGVRDGLMNEKRITKSFRVYRDVRFSKDKTPYKTNMSGFISYDVTDPVSPAYYFSAEPGGKSMIAGGLWHPEAPTLKKIRQYIDDNPKELGKLESDKVFKKVFPDGLDTYHMLKTNPRAYDKEHEAIKYLRMKSFTASNTFADKEVTEKNFQKKVIANFKALHKLNTFLQKATK